jgi:hypothetical protein
VSNSAKTEVVSFWSDPGGYVNDCYETTTKKTASLLSQAKKAIEDQFTSQPKCKADEVEINGACVKKGMM